MKATPWWSDWAWNRAGLPTTASNALAAKTRRHVTVRGCRLWLPGLSGSARERKFAVQALTHCSPTP